MGSVPHTEVERIVRKYYAETEDIPGGRTVGSVLCTLLFAHEYLSKDRLNAILSA